LNEGFATYSEALYYEVKEGKDAYREYMDAMDYSADGWEKAIYVYDTTYDVFNNVIYDKGAWVLHMLRKVVGEEDFFEIRIFSIISIINPDSSIIPPSIGISIIIIIKDRIDRSVKTLIND